jgi:membrane-bound ClpP family serine protease
MRARCTITLALAMLTAVPIRGTAAEADPFDADPFESVVAGEAVVAGEVAGEIAASPPPVVAIPLVLPITGNRDVQLRAAVERSLPKLESMPGKRGVLVVRFDADEADGGIGSDFGRAVEVARFLAGPRLAGVKTVAWLPRTIRGHAVLPALACEEIVMAPDAVLGPANADEQAVDDAVRAAYRQIASVRRTVSPEVAVALVDPSARAVRVSTERGNLFVSESQLPEIRKRMAVLDVEELQPAPIAPTGRRGRELGIVRLLAETPADLERGLGLSPGSLKADATASGGWKAVEIVIAGPIDAGTVARARGRLEAAVAEGANFVGFRIDSPGGAPEQSLALAAAIAATDPASVRTVAYVPREARADAALVALACDELAMHPDAVIGGEGAAVIDQRSGEAIAAAWRESVASRKGRPWSLAVAMVKPGLVVHRATRERSGQTAYFSEEELGARDDRDEWRLGPQVGTGPILAGGRTAESLGLASQLVDSAEGLARAYGIDGPMKRFEPRWSDRLLDALASPGIAWLLLVIGGAGLYLELQTPGLGLGGFVAMVAFIIYFWGQYLHGTSGWLEVLLFAAGLFCLAAEIFVLPGFGVLGLGGGVLVVASIVLASQSFVLPSNDYQVRQLQWSLGGILAAFVSVTALAVLMRRWLPAAPGLRGMALEPPSAEEFTTADLGRLVGIEGVTTTRLAPAGKARIDGQLHDVTTEGHLIEPGSHVRVEAVRGGRIVVSAHTRREP